MAPPECRCLLVDVSTDTSTLSPVPGARRRFGFGRRSRVAEVLDVNAPLTTVPSKPPRLLLRFGIYAGIAVVVAAAAGTWLAGHNARIRARDLTLG